MSPIFLTLATKDGLLYSLWHIGVGSDNPLSPCDRLSGVGDPALADGCDSEPENLSASQQEEHDQTQSRSR
jgi:hypothetical protein